MGSQTLEILRQGVWASLTGGWFYDPHQNVFCNAVHLYLWLFLLCAPFVTYLYFPKTFTTWCAYCFTTAFTITMLKIVNMALHILYDKAQTMSEPNLKKPLKSLKESEGEDECGIEMQVLGADAPSGTSAEQPVNETSGANSMLSIDCQEHMTSTIDLKVDVHRKNSSESSDSLAIYSTNPSIPTFPCQSSNNPRRSLKVKSKSEERPSKNPSITEEIIAQEGLIYTTKCYSSSNNEYYNVVTRKGAMKRKTKSKLERQISFDAVEAAAMDLSLARSQNSNTCCDIDIDNCNDNILRKTNNNNHKSTKLQRHKSSDSSNDDRQKRGRALFLNRHEQETRSDIRNQLQFDMDLENSYTKSDLDIENIECENSKLFLLQQTKTMRKDSNSTMSALQLSSGCTNTNNMKRRRHSNTGCKPIMNNISNSNNNSSSNVRRIKSAALEISCQQPSVSNLSPHPNSVETIAGQQIKNPQSAMLPPPSKCLVRNPHFNLCPSSFTNSGNIATTMEPVYPIAEQADEKSLYTGELDSENENIEQLDNNLALRHKRCSTTESESDMDRPRTQSTDSETDNNGSRSPLLNKINRHNSKCKNIPEEIKIKSAGLPLSIVDDVVVVNSKMLSNDNKKSDSGCPSSDCEQASASSKDMLLSRDKDGLIKLNKSWNGLTDGSSIKTTETQLEIDGTDGCCIEEDKRNYDTKTGKNGKNLGAIPKTVVNKRDDTNNANSKTHQGAIPKSTSRTSSSASSRSYSAESFSNEIYKPYKEQWLMVSGAGHNQHQPILPIFNYPRRTILESGLSSRLRCSSDSTKRNGGGGGDNNNDNNNQRSKIEEISTSIDFRSNDLQNTVGNTTLSIQGLINDQYSFENSITSEQRPPTGAILNIGHVEFNDAVYCDYWRPCNLVVDKPVKPKRFYKYRLQFFGRREFKIAMDRLQLLALFDRDLHWFHVILAVALSFSVCFLGSIILQLGFYKDVFAFLFCVVIAGSQYSLLKSVQPDASSPIHGFNKTVAYSRPIYFCLFSSLLVFSHHLAKELDSDTIWKAQQKELRIFGMPFSLENFLQSLTRITSIILLFFPVFFSLGLFPQINTFCMYLLEQIDMHIFGGSAACSLTASILSVLKSILAVSILYGPAFGGLTEEKGTQHISFSIFCALLIPIAYHLSRTASDFTHIWALIKSSLVSIPDDDEDEVTKIKTETSDTTKIKEENNSQQKNESSEKIDDKKKVDNDDKTSSTTGNDATTTPTDTEPPDPLPKKLQHTVNSRLKNDILVASVLGVFVLGLHCSTVFTVLQPDLNTVLYSIAGVLGFMLHYVLPQMRKHLPWLCFSRPILRQQEFGKFEVSKAAKIMWFEIVYVCLCFLERNLLYPLIFISALTADSQLIVRKFGAPFGAAVVSICALKCVRSSYSDLANQYLILIFSVLLFKVDFRFASETFLVDYFVVSIIFKKSCDFLLKLQFIVTYIAPWQITWGSAFHAFAQPFSVPHSAMLFMQAAISAILSTPLNPFLGSAIFLTSYARPIKFWERDYNTRRIDHSNTRLSSQLERDLGADDNNLNSIFYEHLTRSLQHSLCGDLLLGRWGQVNQGDCFVLASDYLNCLVHIIELGNGICTFQMRGLEFRGTYCQQREVEAISEGVEENDGCCCCAPGHLPKMLSANAMFSTRWLAWQVVAAQYVLEGYSISENLATATLQVFEFRKVLITYYIKSIIYYVTRNNKLDEWLSSGPIQDALTHTLNRQFVDLDPIFNYNLDEDFDFRALGITRTSFCSVYLGWIQFCYAKKEANNKTSSKNNTDDKSNAGAQCCDKFSPTNATENNCNGGDGDAKLNNNGNGSVKSRDKQPPKINHKEDENTDSSSNNNTITKDSSLVSLCLALGLLARRSLATASHSSLSGVEFFLHGLHALFKGDFRITSPRDEWVFADMELLHGVVAPAVKMALKLHQDHFSSPDEYLDPSILYDAISSHSKDLVISHEADPIWRSAVLRGAPNLLALRHVMEDGSDEYRIIRLTKRFLSFRVIKLNRECVRGLWAGQQQELIYLRNRNPERGSIQNAKQALRNIINSSCDQPIGYPIYVSPLTTSYAETNEQLCRIIGGSITLDTMRVMILDCWNHIRQRCREGCSSGSGGMECDTGNEVPGVYFSPAVANNTTATLSYGSQSLSGAGTRGSLASMNKPNSSTLLAGFLNRERDQERESIRERSSKRSLQNRADRERRATLPYTLSAISGSSRDFFVKDAMGSTNSGLRQNDGTDPCFSNKISSSSGNLGSNDMKTSTTDSCKANYDNSETSNNAERSDSANSTYPLIELSKKVIIVDGTEIYDCLDLGRRIDVVWPNEKMRSNGGRSSWKDWSPQEGMVGYVVHYWQPNHTDQRFRSNVNRTLYLVEIGDRYVPVGESGIREYNQIPDINLFRPAFSSLNNNNNNCKKLTIRDASTTSSKDIPKSPNNSDIDDHPNRCNRIDCNNFDNETQTDQQININDTDDDDDDSKTQKNNESPDCDSLESETKIDVTDDDINNAANNTDCTIDMFCQGNDDETQGINS